MYRNVEQGCHDTAVTVHNWFDTPSASNSLEVIRVETESLVLAFLPGAGGRLLSLRVSGVELLWQNPSFFDVALNPVIPRSEWPIIDGTMKSWANIGGSKTWPAPQGWAGPGQWPGPPDAILDAGPWSMELQESTDQWWIVLGSPKDLRSGLQVQRNFQIPKDRSSFTEIITFTNVMPVPISWSIWEVCQVATELGEAGGSGHVVVSVADESPPVVLAEAVGRMEVDTRIEGCVSIPIAPVVGKLGFPSASGSVSYLRNDGHGLTLEFDPIPGADYPDQGSRAELWMQTPLDYPLAQFGDLESTANLVELEILSPSLHLAPGGSDSLTIHWSAF